MRKITGIIIGSILISLIAPTFAALQPYTVNGNRGGVEQDFNIPAVNSVYSWSNPPAIDLSGINLAIFRDGLFKKEPGGILSGNAYTESMNRFLKDDPDAGVSRIAMKSSKIGLVHWP